MIKEEEKDNDSVLVRTEVLNNIRNGEVDTLITYPEALAEKVVDREVLSRMSMVVNQGDALSISFIVKEHPIFDPPDRFNREIGTQVRMFKSSGLCFATEIRNDRYFPGLFIG